MGDHSDSSPGPCGGAPFIGLIGATWTSTYRFLVADIGRSPLSSWVVQACQATAERPTVWKERRGVITQTRGGLCRADSSFASGPLVLAQREFLDLAGRR